MTKSEAAEALANAAWKAMEKAKSCEAVGDLAGVKAHQIRADDYRAEIAKLEAQR